MQVPYTPSRTVYSSFLLQANDPLVHYMAADLNSLTGAWAVWANRSTSKMAYVYQSDDPAYATIAAAAANPIGGRYQPWLQPGQMDTLANGTVVVPVTNNYAVKDPQVWIPDNWDFPTNLYPTVGWIGRVHRGTPWQTVYLKDADMLESYVSAWRATPIMWAPTLGPAGRATSQQGLFRTTIMTPPIPRRCRIACCSTFSPLGSTTTPCAERCRSTRRILRHGRRCLAAWWR